MTTRPIEFLKEGFPKLFNRGVEVLRARAEAGDERAKRILEDVTGVTGAIRFEVDREPPVVLSTAAGTMSAGDAPANDVPLKVMARVPADALELVLGQALEAGALEDEEVAVGAAQTASKRFEDALEDRPMTFAATVQGVPGLGDVQLEVAFNVPELHDRCRVRRPRGCAAGSDDGAGALPRGEAEDGRRLLARAADLDAAPHQPPLNGRSPPTAELAWSLGRQIP